MTATIDQQKLQGLIESYKADFPKYINCPFPKALGH